jgi:O-antigen ligase
VGLSNFTPVATTHPRYQAAVDNIDPLNSPHNNLGWIAGETGIAGLVPFVLSQILLVVAFRRLAKRGERGRAAWKYFVFIFLSYWITGMSETSAYYGELNMWFIFAVALVYRYGVGETPECEQLALPVAEGAAG